MSASLNLARARCRLLVLDSQTPPPAFVSKNRLAGVSILALAQEESRISNTRLLSQNGTFLDSVDPLDPVYWDEDRPEDSPRD